jgi:cytochrome c oxidase subunit 1
MGISYWLVPHLARRALFSRGLALAQVWLWFGGMLIFSPTLHELGLRGMPRRTMIGHVSYMQPEWKTLLPLVGIGGAILFVSATLFFLNMILTATVSRGAPQPVPAFADTVSGPDHAPAFVDRWQPWLAAAVILIAIAYGPTLVRLAVTTPLTTPGLRVW